MAAPPSRAVSGTSCWATRRSSRSRPRRSTPSPRQAATLAVLSEQLQAQLVKGKPLDADILAIITGQLRRVLADQKRGAQAGAPERPSIHDHLIANHDAGARRRG
jgi:hypothetical protein